MASQTEVLKKIVKNFESQDYSKFELYQFEELSKILACICRWAGFDNDTPNGSDLEYFCKVFLVECIETEIADRDKKIFPGIVRVEKDLNNLTKSLADIAVLSLYALNKFEQSYKKHSQPAGVLLLEAFKRNKKRYKNNLKKPIDIFVGIKKRRLKNND